MAHAPLRIAAAGRIDPAARGLRVERFRPVDLADLPAVGELLRNAPEPAVVNFAARTDVDRIESERPAGPSPRGGPAWTVNTDAVAAMARAAREGGKYLVQISTDFVYDGTDGPYSEEAPVAPYSERLSWYGWTKSAAEAAVRAADPGALVLRIAYPYREHFPEKLDFARWMQARYREGTLPGLFADQQITPTWIPDLTRALPTLLERRTAGILHLASPSVTTPYEFGTALLARPDGGAEIRPASLEASPAVPGRAPRPLRGGLRTDRALGLGLTLTPWRRGIQEILGERRGQ